MREKPTEPASLEALVETGMLALDSLHPGGLETSRRLAELCGIASGTAVLDVASGTGETACFLAETRGARVRGIDVSEDMIRRAKAKAGARGLEVEFGKADATDLPFGDSEFDAVLCECTLCFLDKARVLGEMTRVARRGGRVGMHDLYWMEGVPDGPKRALAEIEREMPETLDGWRLLFERTGLVRVTAVDLAGAMSRWMRDSRKQLGWVGQIGLVRGVLRRWGVRGLRRVLRSERIFSSGRLGYAIVVGTKP